MTNQFLIFGLDIESYFVIGCIVLLGILFGIFLSMYLIPYIVMKIREVKEKKKDTVPPGQMILPEMQKQLIQLPEKSFKTTLTVLTKVLPEFKNYLKNRPESNAEANDLYLIYLQIMHKCMTLFPITKDEIAFFEKNQKAIQTMSKYLQYTHSKGWLMEMDLVLFEIYRFLSEMELDKGQQFINLETIRYLLSKARTLKLENDKTELKFQSP
ncbi:MAG: hypothetical protein ACTSO7_13765 [Candidatus Heimdallarchaeota archaeon]